MTIDGDGGVAYDGAGAPPVATTPEERLGFPAASPVPSRPFSVGRGPASSPAPAHRRQTVESC